MNRLISIATLILCTGPLLAAEKPVVEKPNWDMEVINWDFGLAYPETTYDFRLAVIGGRYPYTFELKQGPKGLELDRHTGAITWPAPDKQPDDGIVSVVITDAGGQKIKHSYALKVTKAPFRFCAPNGDDADPGTFEKPWRTFQHARAATKKGDVIYFRQGTHPTGGDHFQITDDEAHVWMSWPGEQATIDAGILTAVEKKHDYMADVSAREEHGDFLFQDLEFVNAGSKVLRVWGIKHAIFRRNHVHKLTSKGRNNPAFVMFTDDARNYPADGRHAHYNVVFQENTIHDIRNNDRHASAATTYNVVHLLFEDNHVYDIQGSGINEKDDGYFNTIRNNRFHDVDTGVYLLNQHSQLNVDVHHNLIYDVQKMGIGIGCQPGYIRDIYVHHNTIAHGSLWLRWVLSESLSGNVNIYNNIVIPSELPPYVYDSKKLGGMLHEKSAFESNILQIGPEDLVIRERWNKGRKYTFKEWQAAGQDAGSVYTNVDLDEEYKLPEDSPYYETHGWNTDRK